MVKKYDNEFERMKRLNRIRHYKAKCMAEIIAKSEIIIPQTPNILPKNNFKNPVDLKAMISNLRF